MQQVLIFGCSYGHEVYYIHQEFPDIRIFAYDIDSQCIESCKKMNIPNAKFTVLNMEKKEDVTNSISGSEDNAGIVCLETLYFISPSGVRNFFSVCAQTKIKAVFIEAHVNTICIGKHYNPFIEKKSRYSGIQGSWDHNYFTIISQYFDIYSATLVDQRLRASSVHTYQDPWIICARRKGALSKFFYER